MTDARCDVQMGQTRFQCDREPGHDGPHCTYDDTIDEPLFWSDTAGDADPYRALWLRTADERDEAIRQLREIVRSVPWQQAAERYCEVYPERAGEPVDILRWMTTRADLHEVEKRQRQQCQERCAAMETMLADALDLIRRARVWPEDDMQGLRYHATQVATRLGECARSTTPT